MHWSTQNGLEVSKTLYQKILNCYEKYCKTNLNYYFQLIKIDIGSLINKNRVSLNVVREAEKLSKTIQLFKPHQPKKVSPTCLKYNMFGCNRTTKLSTKKAAAYQEEYCVTLTMKNVRNQVKTYDDNYIGIDSIKTKLKIQNV